MKEEEDVCVGRQSIAISLLQSRRKEGEDCVWTVFFFSFFLRRVVLEGG